MHQHPVQAFAAYQDWLLNNLVPQDTKVLRCYLNGHTFGTDGWPHTDTDRDDELTMVLYLNPEWCGETVVFDDDGEITASTLPRKNRIMIFPSNYLHCPRPLSKVFQGMRAVLVVKMGSATGKSEGLYRQDDPDEQPHIESLRELGAHTTAHSGRILLHHLLGVYRLLKRRGAPEDVCLAWLFCNLDRPACWSVRGLSLTGTEGKLIQISREERNMLALLEQANLYEQGIVSGERAQAIQQQSNLEN